MEKLFCRRRDAVPVEFVYLFRQQTALTAIPEYNNDVHMSTTNISRKEFLKNSALGLAGIATMPISNRHTGVGSGDNIPEQGPARTNGNTYRLQQVRLETGFEYHEGEVIGTKTDLFSLEISDGKITSIGPDSTDEQGMDAEGLLMLPSFRDMHIHLDKTYYGDKWQAIRRGRGGVKGMISLEQQILPDLLKNSVQKAEKLIELLQSNGTGFARSHVNIEPTSKLQSLRHLQQALEHKKAGFAAELVAFPQHGVYYTDSAPYMREAASSGVDFIGGLDPTSIDGAIEKTMDFTVQLALDHQKGIDIHLHESGESGVQTIDYLIDKVLENPSLKRKTYVSHAFCLGQLEAGRLNAMIQRLAEAEIGIVSTIPFGSLVMPIPALLKQGVTVMTGNDSIVDHWNTFGTGSVLQKANLAAQLYGASSEFGLSRMLKLATAGPIPLDDAGKQQWPKVGDPADFVLVDASCSAEAVSRIAPVRSLVHQGKVVYA